MPLATEKIWQDLYSSYRDQGQKGVPICALSGIDIALWDIKGKHFNAPVHQLMGGPPCARTSRPMPPAPTASAAATRSNTLSRKWRGTGREGFSAVKLKIGFDVDEDAELIERVRHRIGPDMGLMLDANHGYDSIDAIRLAKKSRTPEYRMV